MTLLKNGQIANCCGPNAMLTLMEYLKDYASESTRCKGLAMIRSSLDSIPNPKVREKTEEYLKKIQEGQRDFRF